MNNPLKTTKTKSTAILPCFLHILLNFENPIIKELNRMFDKICLILVIIGSLNWGLVGLFEFDLVAWAFGGATSIISRIIYTVIALAGIWCISLLFRDRTEAGD